MSKDMTGVDVVKYMNHVDGESALMGMVYFCETKSKGIGGE